MTVPKLSWFMYWNWREWKVASFHVTVLRQWSWERGLIGIIGGGILRWTEFGFIEVARRAR